jgi:hypothetical protein
VRIREILPGIFHWTAVHPAIRTEVSCHYVEPARMLLDPLVPEEGLKWFERRGLRVRGFAPGEVLPGGIESLEVGVLCPDETAFRIPGRESALAVADGVVRDADGPLAFVPDPLLGDDPEAVKRGLRSAYRRLLSLDFEHLLLAHGHPWLGGARQALAGFVS